MNAIEGRPTVAILIDTPKADVDLYSRIMDHKNHIYKNSFTDRYNCVFCIYYEHYPTVQQAISREKEIKKWRREKKDLLIGTLNPKWEDLWNDIRNW